MWGGKFVPDAANIRRVLKPGDLSRSSSGKEFPMSYLTLVDGPSAAIVLGGTVLGTFLRCGQRRSLAALRGLQTALRPSFRAEHARSELALQLQEIHREGLLRSEPHHTGDAEFDEVADAMIGQRTVAALLDKHHTHQAMRQAGSQMATATFNQAAELAPVFGLAGTLIALSQLPTAAAPGTMLSASIPTAIVTTFYGLMAAHLFFAPIARFIERRTDGEAEERRKLIDWLASELERETMRRPAPQSKFAA